MEKIPERSRRSDEGERRQNDWRYVGSVGESVRWGRVREECFVFIVRLGFARVLTALSVLVIIFNANLSE